MTWLSTATPRNRPEQLRAAIAERLGALGLELHPEKTKIVYCKDTNRRGSSEHTSFDFLGYTFRGRLAEGRRGFFVSFLPAMSATARRRRASRSGPGTSTAAVARTCPASPRRSTLRCGAGSTITGPSTAPSCTPCEAHRRTPRPMGHAEVQATTRQARRAWRGSTVSNSATADALRPLAARRDHRKPVCGSRMTGDCHVRFCESRRGRFPPATRHYFALKNP